MSGDNLSPEEVLSRMEECKTEIDQRLESGDVRMDSLLAMIEEVTKATLSIKESTDEILGIYKSGKIFFKVWGWFGGVLWKGAKFVGAVSVAVTALYALYYAAVHGVPTEHITKQPHK